MRTLINKVLPVIVAVTASILRIIKGEAFPGLEKTIQDGLKSFSLYYLRRLQWQG